MPTHCFKFWIILISTWAKVSSILGALVNDGSVTLTILHTNDVHSRFLQTSKYGGSCSEENAANGECYGGFSRLHYKVTEIRKTHPNVLYLSAGDYFQGTVWYTLYKWKYVAQFVNQFNHTAMALGNHEFDDGVNGLLPFLEAVKFPIISSNINISKEPQMAGKFEKSVVVKCGGWDVGIIGYTTTETPDVSKPGNLTFEDELESVTREAKRLHDKGIKVLIALGHAGYDVDLRIATAPHIDLVVGGHTNTFLYTGTPPDIDQPMGDYPTIVHQASGRIVPVVQAYAYGKYLGYLNITLNEAGEVTHWDGAPLLLNNSVPQDQTMEAELQETSKLVQQGTRNEVGRTRVFLDGSELTCRMQECNLGNVIADAMLEKNVMGANGVEWSPVTMAIINGGGIRSSVDEITGHGSVTVEDVLTVFPFQNTIDIIEIQGKYLREAFEFSVEGYDPKGFHLSGKFLQVSGVRVQYEIDKPEGQRVRKLEVLCKQCRVPKYELINETKIYQVTIPTFVATGGDGYKVIKNNLISHRLSGVLDSDMLLEYLKRRSPIIQGLDGRISFYTSADREKACLRNGSEQTLHMNLNYRLAILIFCVGILLIHMNGYKEM